MQFVLNITTSGKSLSSLLSGYLSKYIRGPIDTIGNLLANITDGRICLPEYQLSEYLDNSVKIIIIIDRLYF